MSYLIMNSKSRDVLRLLEDFIYIKLDGRLNHRELSFVFHQAYVYADSVEYFWPDDDVSVSFNPKEDV